MRIQLTSTQANGKADVVARQYQAGQPVHIPALPGSSVTLEIDGQPVSGKTSIKGKRPALQRRDDDLVVMLDGEPVAVIQEFFVTPDIGLEGTDWVLAQAAGEAMPAVAEAAPAAAESSLAGSEGGSGNAMYWALGAAGLVGAVAVAAGGSSSGSGSSSSANVKASSPVKVSGQVVAGPLLENHGLQVSLYKADGTLLAEGIKIDANGLFKAEYDQNYKGIVIAKVVDTTPDGADYHDEATNAPKGLVADLRAVFSNPASGAIDVVVSPLSELVTRALGLAPDATQAADLTAKQIADTSHDIAQKLGLDDGVFGKVIPVVEADGKSVAAPNLAGLVLTALSGLEHLHGLDASMDLLLKAVASPDNNEISGLLISGSREAGQIPGRDFIKLWTDTAPASDMAAAVTSASKLSNDTITTWSAADLGALALPMLAALTPEQMDLIPAAAIAGLSKAQMQMLDSACLQPLMAKAALSAEQAQALSPLAVALGMGLNTLVMALTDDSAGGDGVAIEQANRQAATKDATPKLSGVLAGKLPVGAELILFNGTQQLGKATVNEDRQTWSYTPSAALADGLHDLSACVSLQGGQMSVHSIPLQLTTDATQPSVVITADKTSLSAGETATITFTFSEALLAAPQAAQFTVANGTLGALKQDAKSPTVYTAIFTPAADVAGSPASITVNPANYSDKVGNIGAEVVFNQGLTVDTVAPTVSAVAIVGCDADGAPKAGTLATGDKIRVTVTMSEDCNVAEGATYAITVGDALKQAKYLSGNGTTALVFEYTVEPGDSDDAGGITAATNALSLGEGGKWGDVAGNAGPTVVTAVEADVNAIAVDAIGPVMQALSVAALDAQGQNVANGTPARIGGRLEFTVQFEAAPTITQHPELAFLFGEEEKKAVYDRTDGNNLIFRYEVQGDDHVLCNAVNVIPQTALLTTDTATIKDALGNAVFVPENIEFTRMVQDTAFVDGRQAKIASIEIVEATGIHDTWLNVGDTVTARVTFDKAVQPSGTAPTLTLMFGDRPATVAYTGSMDNATTTFDFVFTLERGDLSPDGIAIPVDALQTGGSLIENHNPANLKNIAVAANPAYRVDCRDVDVSAVCVTGMTSAGVAKTGDLTGGDKVRIEVETSVGVTVSGTPQYDFTVGGQVYRATYVPRVSSSQKMVFEYTVPEGTTLNGEITIATNALQLGAETIRNAANTDLTTTMLAASATTGKISLLGATADKFGISADLVKAASVNGAYAVVLGNNDSIAPTGMGEAQYGYWQQGDTSFHRRWTTTKDGQEIHLLAKGGEGPLDFASASCADTIVTITFSQAVTGAAQALPGSWTASSGTVTVAAFQRDGNELQLTMDGNVTTPLTLDYTGPALYNAGGEGLKYSRLVIGTANNDVLDGSMHTGNQAIVANAGGSQMTGGAGSDMLVAGTGNDTMTGGLGADTFVWSRGATGTDTIEDFSRAQGDCIDLSKLIENFDRNNLDATFQFARTADTNNATLTVDLNGGSNFAAGTPNTLTITMNNCWPELSGSTLRDLVNQDVIRV